MHAPACTYEHPFCEAAAHHPKRAILPTACDVWGHAGTPRPILIRLLSGPATPASIHPRPPLSAVCVLLYSSRSPFEKHTPNQPKTVPQVYVHIRACVHRASPSHHLLHRNPPRPLPPSPTRPASSPPLSLSGSAAVAASLAFFFWASVSDPGTVTPANAAQHAALYPLDEVMYPAKDCYTCRCRGLEFEPLQSLTFLRQEGEQ